MAPPDVWPGLRISGGRVLPVLLAAERCHVEQAPAGAELLDAAARREVRAINVVAVAKEDAQPERLTVLPFVRPRLLGRDAEVEVEIAVERRVPGHRPSHPLSERLDPGERCPRD